jgi:hypothetical protein
VVEGLENMFNLEELHLAHQQKELKFHPDSIVAIAVSSSLIIIIINKLLGKFAHTGSIL